jgi:hypothetical protein
MEANMRGQMGNAGQGMNPFGDVQSAGVAAQPQPRNEELETALGEIKANNDVETQRACLTTLQKITANIVKDPYEAKFRQIKMENAAFAKKVAGAQGGVEVMVAMGWMPDTLEGGEDVWKMDLTSASNLKPVSARIAEELQKLPQAPAAAPAPAPVASPAPGFAGGGGLGGGMGGMPGMPGMPGMGGMGGMGGMDPAMIQQAMQNPQVQAMMQNPAMMQQMMNNPQVQQMMAGNPAAQQQMQQLMQNPEQMQQMMQMMQNMNMNR